MLVPLKATVTLNKMAVNARRVYCNFVDLSKANIFLLIDLRDFFQKNWSEWGGGEEK